MPSGGGDMKLSNREMNLLTVLVGVLVVWFLVLLERV
jgi:hypothetical protein